MLGPPRAGLGGIPAVAWSSVLGLLAVILLFAIVITHDRDELVAGSEERAGEQALVLADHAARLFEAAETALSAVIDETQTVDWSTTERSRPLWERMRRLADRLPYVEGLWLYGPKGRLRLSSMAFPSPPIDASSRDFFVVHASGHDIGVHVSDVVQPSDGQPTFRLSRRLSGPNGEFRGVASLTIDIAFFRTFYATLGLPEGSKVNLLRAHDLAAIAGPGIDDIFPMLEAVQARPDAGRFRTDTGKGVGVLAYRQVPGFPLLVAVEIPLSAIHDTWLERVAWRAPMALGAGLALAALTWLGFRQAERQTHFQNVLEQKVAERTRELAEANAQLELLVQEVHHRVNNNLQVIVSLLALQAARISDPGGRRAIRQCTGRVHTLSLVHQTLYGTGAMVDLAFRSYLERLAQDVGDLYGRTDVTVKVEGANPVLPLDIVVPLALVVHEALCNAMRHAFAEDAGGHVRIILDNGDDQCWTLEIADDGVGLPEGAVAEGLGMTMIRSLAAQVGATANLVADHGTRVTLRIPKAGATLCT